MMNGRSPDSHALDAGEAVQEAALRLTSGDTSQVHLAAQQALVREQERSRSLARRVQALEDDVKFWSRAARSLTRRQRELQEEVARLRWQEESVNGQYRLHSRFYDGVDSGVLGTIINDRV
ncbi:hypothetical protein [Nocardiopsis sp. MG754419]|uniref:hypothetical protein n=1 Tax=Nocardiopsis sp. MG754419 TaxID=2259865 RepID=UPI001BA4B95E|nr:hypothetical protein [Nocardiopsis sp. MG754419]MBR8743704.1 hypothetical protein [Nocardiopsis sp. MG754419]